MSSRRASIDRLVRRFGDGLTVTLRRRNTLRAYGANVTALALVGAVSLGATTISLDAAALQGTIRQGATLTIAGVSGTYTVAADVTAASGVLTDVTLATPLAGGAADNAVVTIVQGWGDYTFRAKRGRRAASTGAPAAIERERTCFHLSAISAPTTPETGDVLVDAGAGERERVGSVRERRSGAVVTGWVVELGEAAA